MPIDGRHSRQWVRQDIISGAGTLLAMLAFRKIVVPGAHVDRGGGIELESPERMEPQSLVSALGPCGLSE